MVNVYFTWCCHGSILVFVRMNFINDLISADLNQCQILTVTHQNSAIIPMISQRYGRSMRGHIKFETFSDHIIFVVRSVALNGYGCDSNVRSNIQ